MLSCREVARHVASDGLEEQSWLVRAGVRFHLLMCRHCREYSRQLRALGALARRLGKSTEPDEAHIQELGTKILDTLDRKRSPDQDRV